ncbi:MAG: hypothetical protein KDD82_02425, partial [Planctomycetes bacterium]|nr:hypothetical protein [Planctomycetota bacterium]
NAARDAAGLVEADPALRRWLLGDLGALLLRRFELPDPALDPDAAERALSTTLQRTSVLGVNDEGRRQARSALAALLALGEGTPEREWGLRVVERAVQDGYRGPGLLDVLDPWLQALPDEERVAWLRAYGARGPRQAVPAALRLLGSDPLAAARLLPAPQSVYGRRTDRQERERALAVVLAAGVDPATWRGPARELLFAADGEVRVLARAALGDPRWEESA